MNKKNFDKHFNGFLMGFANYPVVQKLLKEGAVNENLSRHMAVLEYSAEKVLKWVNDNCKQGADVDKIFDNCSTLLDKCQNAIGDVANDINTIKGNNPKLAEELNGFYGEVKNFASSFNDYKNKFKDALKEYVKAPQIDDDPIIEYFPDEEFDEKLKINTLSVENRAKIAVFPKDPSGSDIVQTNDNACYLLAGLHSLAENHPDAVKNLIRDNGDGTVTVKFYPWEGSGEFEGSGKKKEMLVTIDKTLPGIDRQSANWVRLLEKALGASKLITSNGYEPDKNSIHTTITIDNIDGAQPVIPMSVLDPGFNGSIYDRNYVSDQMKSLKSVHDAHRALARKLLNAKKNGSVIALCSGGHVVDVTNIKYERGGEYDLSYYDQLLDIKDTINLREAFTKGPFDSLMVYDFASKKDSHEATYISFKDILAEVRDHEKDPKYKVPDETKQWMTDLAAGKGEPPLIPMSQEEAQRYAVFNRLKGQEIEARDDAKRLGKPYVKKEDLPQLFVPVYEKEVKEEIKKVSQPEIKEKVQEKQQIIKEEPKPEIKKEVQEKQQIIKEEPKPEIKEEIKEAPKKEPKKLNFTNQFIAKVVEKTTVKNNQRIKSEGVDYGGISIEIQMTNDIRYMNNWYARNKEKLSPEADAYFKAQYESARYFEMLSLTKASNKKTPTDMNVGFYYPELKEQNEFEKGEYSIPNLGKQRNQTSGSGCWSCAFENLLRSRGVDIPQEMIRSFRSNNRVYGTKWMSYKTDSREKNRKGVNGKRNVALEYMTDTSVNVMSRADLMIRVLPNTAMRTKEFSFPTESLLSASGVTEDTVDEKLIGNKMLETVRDAIGLSRSPVAVYFGGHYRTISAVNIEKRTIKWVDSMHQDPNAESEIKIDDLIVHCRTARPNASIEFTWMEDLVPDEKGNCSINGFEDYKYNGNKLYKNGESNLQSSDDFVKDGILANKTSVGDNNLMISETVCLPKDLIKLSAYKQQIPPEVEVSGKPYVYAEDPYPLPTNEHILVRKPSAAPDKIDDLKIVDLERNPKIYDDPQDIMFRENVNIVLNSWDEKEKYFPDEVDNDGLKNRIRIDKNNRTQVLNSFIGAINKMNNTLTEKGEEVLKFPDWQKGDRLFRCLASMQDDHYELHKKLIEREQIFSRYTLLEVVNLPDKDHVLSVEPLEAKAKPASQESDAIKELNRYFEGSVYEKIISNNPDMYQIAFGLQYEPENMNEFREAAKNISNDLLVDDETRRNALRRRYKDWFKNSDNLMEVQRLCTDEELTVLPNLDVDRFLDKMSEMQLNNITRYNDALTKKEEPQIAPVKEEIKKEEPQIAPVKEEIKVEEPQIDLKQQEPQIDPKMQAQINQQVKAFVNSKGILDDMLKQQLGDAYNPEEMKAVHNQMEAKFMKDKIYETLAKEGIIKNVLGYGLGTRLATYNHLIMIGEDENVFKSQLLDIGYAMEELKPETMKGLFEQGKINKAQLDYYNNNRNEFNGDAAVEYVQGEFYKKANSLAEQLNEPIPFPSKQKQEVKQEVVAPKQKDVFAVKQEFSDPEKQLALFADEISRLSVRVIKTDSYKHKNSMSYKGLQYTLSGFASKNKRIETMAKLRETLKGLNQDVDDYLSDHAKEQRGLFKTCGKARRERIKTCARIKTMKELFDKGIAYDSPEGKKAMLACKLVCAEKLKNGFAGFKELCQAEAIKKAVDAMLDNPVFVVVADKALEKDANYDSIVKMSGSDCLDMFNNLKDTIEKANGIDRNQVKKQNNNPQY